MGALLVHHLQGGLDQALAFLLSWHLLDLLCKSWLVNLQRKYISAESRLSRGEIRKGAVHFFAYDEFIMRREIWMSQIRYAHHCRAVQQNEPNPLSTYLL